MKTSDDGPAQGHSCMSHNSATKNTKNTKMVCKDSDISSGYFKRFKLYFKTVVVWKMGFFESC